MHVLYREGSRFTGAAASHASRKRLRDGSMPDGVKQMRGVFFDFGGTPGNKQTKTILPKINF